MSTVAPSGDISEGKSLDYASITKQIGALNTRLDGVMSIIKEVNVKLEQQDISRKRAALLAQKVALRRRASAAKVEEESEEVAKRKEEEEAKRKKLEELKSRLQEVKTKVEEKRKMREASAAAAPAVTGKGNVGAVSEETLNLGGLEASPETQAYWKEITGASERFKGLGLLSG